MKGYLSFLFPLLLSACGGGMVNGYSGQAVPDDQVAVIFTPRPNAAISAHTRWVDDMEIAGSVTGNPRVVKVLPGIHQIRAVCYVGSTNLRAFPSIRADFQAGHSYELLCQSKDGKTASLSIEDRGTSYRIQ